jgi:uncharacterized protein (DUF305 family)
MNRRQGPAAVMTAAVLTGLLTLPLAAYSSEPAPDQATARFEIDFMVDMINHHHMAVEMARLCEGRADHSELIILCEEIETTQMAEIQQMHHWLMEWYDVSHEPHMKPGHMNMIEKLAALDGADFEIAFMEMMIKHHQAAIREASRCEDRASHQELLELCQQIETSQMAEIATMQTWLCDWYDICKH